MHAKINKETVSVNKLKKNPRNPKRHNYVKIEESVKDVGYASPIVVDEDFMILAGHGRIEALKKLGYNKVDVQIISGLTEKQKEKFMLADNKLVEMGSWDFELLKDFDKDLLKDLKFDENLFLSESDFNTDFTLPSGDKSPFQQITFILADEQVKQIKSAISDIKKIDDFKSCKTFGNENSNGNALYLIVMQWVRQKV